MTAITLDSSISLGALGALIVKEARLSTVGEEASLIRGSPIKRKIRGGNYNKSCN